MFRLSEILTEKGVTSKELSEKTGIPISTIHEYRGARKKNRHYLGGASYAGYNLFLGKLYKGNYESIRTVK